MGRNPKIKLNIKTEKQLNKKESCSICEKQTKYRDLYFYVDESNISITNNSKGVCNQCKEIK